MRDEAELRGHRRTYIGAMPGRIIQTLRRVGVNNPVMMLDEIDKMGNDYRGDPASALLEILDPAAKQYVSRSLSRFAVRSVESFFYRDGKSAQPIPAPLRDRMEIIQLAGYSDQEKLNIAKQYLIPRQIKENGLKPEQLEITDDAINLLTARYTREAGVRQLERTVGNLARKVALKVAQGETEKVTITPTEVEKLSRRAAILSRRSAEGNARRRCDRNGLDGNGRRGFVYRSDDAAGRKRFDFDRTTRRRDERIGAGGASVICGRTPRNSALTRK